MKKDDKITLVGIKTRLASGYRQYKKGCYVCHAKSAKGGMTFHHLWYEPNEKVYSDFRGDNLAYYRYLAVQIKANPERFLYVCNVHHQAITRLRRWRGKNLARLIKAVRMTK